jgi:putative copper export protein
MHVAITNLLNRASKCPVACFLKVLLTVGVIYAIHIALFHQAHDTPYLSALVVDSVGVVAVLALAFHWSCNLRKDGIKSDERNRQKNG